MIPSAIHRAADSTGNAPLLGAADALLHDAARETEPEAFLRLAKAWYLPTGQPERESPKLLHGPVHVGSALRQQPKALSVKVDGTTGALREPRSG